MHINHHSVSSRYCGSKYFHFPYCNMDKFIIKGKRKIDEKWKWRDDSVDPRTLKSATASVPSRDVSANSVEPSMSKSKIPKNVKYRYYNESYTMAHKQIAYRNNDTISYLFVCHYVFVCILYWYFGPPCVLWFVCSCVTNCHLDSSGF
jgi:hypothetical protein